MILVCENCGHEIDTEKTNVKYGEGCRNLLTGMVHNNPDEKRECWGHYTRTKNWKRKGWK